MARGKSNCMLEMGDVFRFNGLRGTNNLSETLLFKIHDCGVDGMITLSASESGDEPFRLFDNNKVRYTDAVAMLNDHTWELVDVQ